MDEKTLAEITQLEESLWRAETRFNRALMRETFADDFLEFGSSGRVYNLDDMLVDVDCSATINAAIPLPEFKARYLTDDVVQVIYVSEVVHGDRKEVGNRSSIWSRVDGKWRLRFHQGTPATA
jgi:hypothetical protein